MSELFAKLSDTPICTGPVECLGIKFENDKERLEFYTQKLKEKLKDPEFRKLEGFPVGKDEDILALSDPPYYTVCPNPFIEEFLSYFGSQNNGGKEYVREPFFSDVSEGKSDKIYRSHQYHTKVPHKAIMRYILHYTEPGDIIFDGFCGSGMTGIAAQMCSDKQTLKSLEFIQKDDDKLFDGEGNYVGKLGCRSAILNDLSPAATLITAGGNLTMNSVHFSHSATEILKEFYQEFGWMYQTIDPGSDEVCDIDVTVWSDIYSCTNCSNELEYWSLAFDKSTGKFNNVIKCPNCHAEYSKRELVNLETRVYENSLGEMRNKQVLKPVEIQYRHNNTKKTKSPDKNDISVLSKVDKLLNDLEYPNDLMMFKPEGERWGVQFHKSLKRVNDFYLNRQLAAFTILSNKVSEFTTEEGKRLWLYLLQSVSNSFTRRNRYMHKSYSQTNRNLSGTLYLASAVSEPSPQFAISGKLKKLKDSLPISSKKNIITTQSLTSVQIPDNSIDYVFIDPPFGDNISYSELNFMWEAWLRLFTNLDYDSVINRVHRKGLSFYTEMMTKSMKKIYKILKPGRWLTVEFHNSRNSVWTAIQESIGLAGFIIADVRVLNKEILTKNQLHANAVDKDLVISAYKPNNEFESEFNLAAGTEEGVWSFIRSHLEKLPRFIRKDGLAEIIQERQARLLFDRMVAFHVQRNLTIPISATEFYSGLENRFLKRDEMYFLPGQATEYEKKRMTVSSVVQLELVISDEESAIQWLRQKLSEKPQTAGELKPLFMQELSGWQKNEKMLELDEILEQNFLRFDGIGDVPSQIHTYLSSNYKELRNKPKDDSNLKIKGKDKWYVPDPRKVGDLEKLRERALLREFKVYCESNQRQLTEFRIEAVRTGFKNAWQGRDYSTIVTVANKIPTEILQSDSKLLMWYDQAVTRLGDTNKI